MTNEEIITKLEATVAKLKELSPVHFNYARFITDFEGDCGTVCCVAGWYPKWFPDANLKWTKRPYQGVALVGIAIHGTLMIPYSIDAALARYHGLSQSEIDYLFYGGGSIISSDLELLNVDEMETTTIEEVIERFEKIIKFYE